MDFMLGFSLYAPYFIVISNFPCIFIVYITLTTTYLLICVLRINIAFLSILVVYNQRRFKFRQGLETQ